MPVDFVDEMSPWRLALASLVFVFAVMLLHWFGLFLIRLQIFTHQKAWERRGLWAIEVSFGAIILSLIALSMLDIGLCAAIMYAHFPEHGLGRTLVFVLGSFTTMGANPPDAANHWQFLGPLLAMCGIFTFGWTTSFLVECSRVHRDAIEDYRAGKGRKDVP